MAPATIFQTQLVLGYVPWLLCFGAYVWPRLGAMDKAEAQRAIATLHSFRFFGLVFIIPGVVGANLPSTPDFAAYGDFATGLLAILALLTFRIRPLFWPFVVAFNLVGASTSSSIIITATGSASRPWWGNWAPPMRSQSSTCRS